MQGANSSVEGEKIRLYGKQSHQDPISICLLEPPLAFHRHLEPSPPVVALREMTGLAVHPQTRRLCMVGSKGMDLRGPSRPGEKGRSTRSA